MVRDLKMLAAAFVYSLQKTAGAILLKGEGNADSVAEFCKLLKADLHAVLGTAISYIEASMHWPCVAEMIQ